jgi:hypothetical protein
MQINNNNQPQNRACFTSYGTRKTSQLSHFTSIAKSKQQASQSPSRRAGGATTVINQDLPVFIDIRKNPNLVAPTTTNQLISKTPDLSRNLNITEQEDDATSKMKMETTFQVSDFLSVDTSQVRGMQNTNNTADKQSNASLPQKQSAFKV